MKRRYRVVISLLLLLCTMVLSILFKEDFREVSLEASNDKPIYRVNKDEKVISLTFDINWAEKDEIYNILEVLDKYNVKATFFYIGRLGNLL